MHQCAQLVLEPSAARDRLTADLSHVDDDGGVARLEKAFLLVTAAEGISRQMHAARLHDWKEAVQKGVITQAQGEKLQAAHEAVSKVIEVDDFAAEALAPIYRKPADVISSSRNWVNRGRQADGETGIYYRRQPDAVPESALGPGPFTPVDLAVQCGRPLLARQPFRPRPSIRSFSVASTSSLTR